MKPALAAEGLFSQGLKATWLGRLAARLKPHRFKALPSTTFQEQAANSAA
jgi:hypothetical protein